MPLSVKGEEPVNNSKAPKQGKNPDRQLSVDKGMGSWQTVPVIAAQCADDVRMTAHGPLHRLSQ